MKTAPASINDTIYSLEPNTKLELFKITLSSGGRLYFSKREQLTWLGNEYSSIPCHLTQVAQNTDGSRNRPRFSFANPAGIFTTYIVGDLLEGGSLEREQVMWSDVQANNDVAIREKYRITKILSVNKEMCAIELKNALDGHTFQLPARAFIPPEFPHVRLS